MTHEFARGWSDGRSAPRGAHLEKWNEASGPRDPWEFEYLATSLSATVEALERVMTEATSLKDMVDAADLGTESGRA